MLQLFCALIVLVIDQVSKFLLGHKVISNAGIAFGLLAEQAVLAHVLALIGLAFFTWYAFAHQPNTTPMGVVRWKIAVGSILGGAASNLVDRMVFGSVRDVFTLQPFGLSVNVADVMIVLGLLALLMHSLTRRQSS